MWKLDHKEGWMPKNWCFQILCPEKTLESPLDSKEIKPVNPKGNQPLILIGRTDAEVGAPVFWPPDLRSQLFGKDPDAGKDWGQEKAATEDEVVGWHHWLNGRDFERTPGNSERQDAWCATVQGVTKSWTWLSSWTTTIFFNVCIKFLACARYFLKSLTALISYRMAARLGKHAWGRNHIAQIKGRDAWLINMLEAGVALADHEPQVSVAVIKNNLSHPVPLPS